MDFAGHLALGVILLRGAWRDGFGRHRDGQGGPSAIELAAHVACRAHQPRGGLRAVRTGYVMRRESKEPDRVFPTPPTWREVFRGSHRTYYAVLYQVGAPDL